MIKGVFMFGVALLAYIRSAHTTLETVWLTDVTTRFSSDKRTFSDLDQPDELNFNLRLGSGDLTLNLKRNYDIDPNADIYFALTSKDGRSILVKTHNFVKEDVAYYQDMENGAFMTVRCVKRSNEQCDRDINGNIQIGDSSYDLRPAETEFTSRNLFEVPDLFAKRYVLQDQAHIQREDSVKNKGNVNEKKVEEEFTALFQRFEAQHKKTHGSSSGATLSSRNRIVVHNSATIDKARQLKKEYYVKVAVLIDYETWKLYASMVSSFNPLTKSRDVKRKIRESYSHIMNGGKRDFKHKRSKVFTVFRRKHIDVNDYIEDLSSWDNDTGKGYTPSYDHAMLFTRYNLFDGWVTNICTGLAYNNMVCDIGGRLSVVQASDYLSTTLAAAHELGHNLGASHDGNDSAIDCKSEDLFIMTTAEPAIDPTRPLSRNLWLFSNCSVEAFKRNLNNKECVIHPGSFYDEQEYKEYVRKEPGEVYTPDDQCHASAGPGSVYCGPDPLKSCYLHCTDPSRTGCQEKLYNAARGTQCGPNMWCIESMCVPKLSDGSTASQFFAYQIRNHKHVGSIHAQYRQDRQPRGIRWLKPQRATPSHV